MQKPTALCGGDVCMALPVFLVSRARVGNRRMCGVGTVGQHEEFTHRYSAVVLGGSKRGATKTTAVTVISSRVPLLSGKAAGSGSGHSLVCIGSAVQANAVSS